ncbi:hypothetical protein DSM106972_031950 [Dulcicalothrix desertica PCC 7102]|uniref:Uncharacterized protein n=1 Tax=Dulcicalothrix desertica PCC 7102 TaxID=232991 RepID=A0A3S1CMV6_9CYAN|nr:DUF3800 domain-containing protein [Dulcicalothrix desertica]RUT05989.1 hypothetical protein DSM106972_031950 [Dulcicalothrix desertica PCC 7102]TWH54339.1 hypothetical protein CAL7102_02363 [Dulcicalothrix desertica PCC 7102]
MAHFDVNQIRYFHKLLVPNADFDSAFTFYYDETNNIRKFYVKERDFNSSFKSNFVLGGVVYHESKPDISKLFSSLNLQRSIQEVKLKYLAKGDFLSCLKSQKLNYFLIYLLENNIYIHYSNINLLYYSMVDIVDSALVNSEAATQLGLDFSNFLKDNLYKLAKLEIDSVVNLFYSFEYPNIKKESVLPFIDALLDLFEDYEDTIEFHIGLTSLKQILKESKKEESLPFIMDEEDYILLKNFSDFYSRPIYLFKNSTHIFDKEDSIESLLSKFVFKDGDKVLQSYSFENSKDNLYIQASDIFIGLVGKFSFFINTNSPADIESSIQNLSTYQLETLDIYLDLIKKSESKNFAFLHSIDSFEEKSKLKLLSQMRNK